MARRLVTALVALLVLGLLGASAFIVRTRGGDATEAPPTVLVDAVAATVAAGPARVSARIEGVPVVPGGVVTTEGVIDLANGRTRFVQPLLGFVEEPVQIVGEGSVLYLQLPPPSMQALGVTTPWSAIDVARLEGALGRNLVLAVPGVGRTDPLQLLELLRLSSESEELDVIGEETVGDVPTTKHRLDVATEEAGERQDEAARPDRYARFLDGLVARRVSVDVWIDTGGRIRRVSYLLPPRAQRPTQVVTFDFTEFGVPETVDVPPPDQVSDITDRIPGIIGGAGR